MDVLIFIGSSAAFFYSIYGWWYFYGTSDVHNYMFFETCATIITLVLLGNLLENNSIKKTTSSISDLSKMQHTIAKREVDGLVEEIKIDEPIIQQDKEGNITEYKVFYSETEGTTIRAVDANGRVKPGVPPIFKDGVYDRSQLTNDLSLFVPEQYRWSDPELENIYRKIQTATTEHINAVAPDTIKPAWVIDTEGRNAQSKKTFRDKNGSVSYTHLKLPTNREV